MTTDLVVREPQALQLSNDQLSYIAATEFVPPGLRGNLPAILACVATGRSLGIPDMTALRSIHVIDGKPTFSAELMVMLARQRGHSIQGEVTEGAANVRGKRADNGDEMQVTWTLAMADRAGLLSKQNWRKYPEAMLWARAVSQLCRELFADVFAGATYTPEELGDESAAGEPLPPSGDPAAGTPFAYANAHDDWEGEPRAENDAGATSEAAASVPQPTGGEAASPTQNKPATAAQKKKLDVLVKGGDNPPPLRRVYATVGIERIRSVDNLILDVGGLDEEGVLHWSPLRESLTRGEANYLIDKLEAVEA